MRDQAKPMTKEDRAKLRAADKCVCGHRRDRHGAFPGGLWKNCCTQVACPCNQYRRVRVPKPSLCPLTPPCDKHAKQMGLPSSVISGKPVKKPNAARRNARALASFVVPDGAELPSSLLVGSPVEATRFTLVGEIKDALRGYSITLKALVKEDLRDADSEGRSYADADRALEEAEATLAELLATALTRARP